MLDGIVNVRGRALHARGALRGRRESQAEVWRGKWRGADIRER